MGVREVQALFSVIPIICLFWLFAWCYYDNLEGFQQLNIFFKITKWKVQVILSAGGAETFCNESQQIVAECNNNI